MSRTEPWEVSQEFWQRAEPLIPLIPLIPQPKGKRKLGRPRQSDQAMLGAILYVLRTDMQWNALPREIGVSTTVYDRFRQ